ncbi:Holliday junction resolvase RuvX [Orientia tsutsugamushi]|uniref:Holliday junction resolvase RuvX n=1 Tax=Orientia tsutsugamushi TaxID=784 RepID=UPI003527E34C
MIINSIIEFLQAADIKKQILGIDFGEKKVGVAISNIEHTVAMPLQTILATNQDRINKIQEIAVAYNIGAIVIGLPFRLDGTETSQTHRVKDFANKLANKLLLPIFLCDERLTSKAANNLLKMGNIKRKVRNAIDDRVAASIILEGALKRMQNSKSYF